MDEILIKEINNISNNIISGLKNSLLNKDEQEINQKYIRCNNSIDLISGNFDSILFLIEYYKITKKPKILELIEEIKLKIIFSLQTENNNFSLFNGKAGLIYVLIQIYKLKKDNNIYSTIDTVIESNNIQSFINSKYVNSSFSTGKAGLLFVLFDLYQIFKEEKNLRVLKFVLKSILSNIIIDNQGLYWKEDDFNIKQPINFINGVSGIIFVLSTISKTFDNSFLKELVTDILKYESNFWDDENLNWKNYKKILSNYDDFIFLTNKFSEKDFDYFFSSEDDTSFYFGSTGIGISKLILYDNFKSEEIFEDINKIIKKLKDNTTCKDFSFAYGKSGHVYFYMKAYEILNDDSLLYLAKHEVKNMIDYKNLHGKYLFSDKKINSNHFDLFSGIEGIGFVFIELYKLIEKSKKSDVTIKPYDNKKQLLIDVSELKRTILSANSNRLYSTINNLYPNILNNYLNTNKFGLNSFIKFIQKNIQNIEIEELVFLEESILNMKFNINNSSLDFIKNYNQFIKSEEILNLLDNDFLETELSLNKRVKVIKTKSNWVSNNERESDDNEFVMLLTPCDPYQVEQLIISEIIQLIINIFKTPKSIRKAQYEFINSIDTDDLSESYLKNLFTEYVRGLIYKGIIK